MIPIIAASIQISDGASDFIIICLFIIVAGIPAYIARPTVQLRRLELKLDALLKNQDIPEPLLSYEVQALAITGKKIAAIKLHREQSGTSLAEAKTDVDKFIKLFEGVKAS